MLTELKGVSRSWLALARRVFCYRLSHCEGQPAPTQLAEITDLNIKVLVDAGRPWEAAAAGRMLPSLATLRWEGFTVSVAAVREVDLDEEEDERPFLGGRAKTALLSCIEGEEAVPKQLSSAASRERTNRRSSYCLQPSPAPALARFAGFRCR